MPSIVTRLIAICATLLLVGVHGQLIFGAELTKADEAAAPRTIAIMPLHNRAGPQYAPLVAAMQLASASEFQQQGKAVAVSRDHLVAIVDERMLEDLGMLEQVDEDGRTWAWLPADVLVFGYVDLVDGELVVEAHLVPADDNDVNWFETRAQFARDYEQVTVRLQRGDAVSAVEQFAEALAGALPEPREPIAQEAAIPGDAAIAVFDLLSRDDPQRAVEAGPLLSEALRQELPEHLPWRMVDREAIYAVLAEHELTLSGLSDQSASLLVGRMVGADYMLVGTATSDEDRTRVDVQLLDVSTAAMVAGAHAVPGDDDLNQVADAILHELSDQLPRGIARLSSTAEQMEADHPEGVTLGYHAHEMYLRGIGDEQERHERARRLMRAALSVSPNEAWVHFFAGNIADLDDNPPEGDGTGSGDWVVRISCGHTVAPNRET